jgi:two-component system, chemotaxis family, protein-glutamate methylesterase/glutaminase
LNAGPTKILVVDDSALFRQAIHNALRGIREASVVGVAKNGVEALDKIAELDPDLLTLDVQMPDMDGIQVLREIKRRRLRPEAIIVSSLTCEGAQVTTDALLEGAFDFILKPSGSESAANRNQLRDALEEKIGAFREAAGRSKRIHGGRRVGADKVLETAPAPDSICRAVIFGTSTGGPEALKVVLPRLSANLPVPVLVVQHMPPQYTLSLAARLNEICPLQVCEAFDRLEALPGQIVIAPGGKQIELESEGGRLLLLVNDDPPENGVRPSVDYLLRSVVDVLGGQALAVIMTGMGRDGLEGCRRLKQTGGYVFAQHQDDCTVYGMPKAVIEEGLADRALPLGKIAPAVIRHLNRSRRS